jgi:hypothetical protein
MLWGAALGTAESDKPARGLGTLYRQTGQAEPARVERFTAIAMYREMAMTFWLPETDTVLAEVEGREWIFMMLSPKWCSSFNSKGE